LTTLNALQTASTGYDMRQVLAIDVPPAADGVEGPATQDFFDEATRRIGALPGVQGVAVGMIVPWRDQFPALKSRFKFEGYRPVAGEEDPTCRFRPVSPRFFQVLGVPILAGRDFADSDRDSSELVAIVSQSVAQRLYPNADALNHHLVGPLGPGARRI